jgi:hypothetical protein
MDTRWSNLEKNCKHDAGLEVAGQERRDKTTNGLGWRAGKKKLAATSTNLAEIGKKNHTIRMN